MTHPVETASTSDAEWLEMLAQSVTTSVPFREGPLPRFPPDELQIRTVGSAGVGAIREAGMCQNGVNKRFAASGLFANENKTLLDFGGGWGRISRCFLRDFHARNMIAMDISDVHLNQFRDDFPGPRLIKCHVFPPTDLPGESIDLNVGYSVFSHLSELACNAWMNEFSFLLKAGGLVAVSTRGRAFFDWDKAHSQAKDIAPMLPDYDEAKAKYDAGLLIVDPQSAKFDLPLSADDRACSGPRAFRFQRKNTAAWPRTI
jgi:hypothetical protein